MSLLVLLAEEQITDTGDSACKEAWIRTAKLTAYSTLAHLGGYFVGAILGRCLCACCDCDSCRDASTEQESSRTPNIV